MYNILKCIKILKSVMTKMEIKAIWMLFKEVNCDCLDGGCVQYRYRKHYCSMGRIKNMINKIHWDGGSMKNQGIRLMLQQLANLNDFMFETDQNTERGNTKSIFLQNNAASHTA